MKRYHLFTVAIICLIAFLSSCNRQLTSVPGRPGDMYECEFIYKMYDCSDSQSYCGTFKWKNWYFHMETALPISPGDIVRIDHATITQVVSSDDCQCE